MYKDWRDYQEKAASVFRRQGCLAEVDAKVEGARGTHSLDVYVSFTNHGIDCNWVIECKLWNSRVTKEKVLVLQSIVDDIGADRGIILTEKGFQRGAYDAVRQSNVTLVTSLEEFERTAKTISKSMGLRLNSQHAENEPPAFEFPSKDQPHTLLMHGSRLLVGNWRTGNISVIDPHSRMVESVIELDNYEVHSPSEKAIEQREIRRHQPGNMTVADGRLFLGQVFSDFILVVDMATSSIVKRLAVPGGGEGSITSSSDGRFVYFASNKEDCFFIIDSATYEYERVPYPSGGRGSMCILAHPHKPHLYIGVQRGGTLDGKSYPGGNSFLAVYDLAGHTYRKSIYLAEIRGARSDDGAPVCLLWDGDRHIYVGMFQSNRGIYKIDGETLEIVGTISFEPNKHNRHSTWVDPLSLALFGNSIVSLNRNNRELVLVNRQSGEVSSATYLGEAPNGPRDVVVYGNEAIVSYPERQGLVFLNLEDIKHMAEPR